MLKWTANTEFNQLFINQYHIVFNSDHTDWAVAFILTDENNFRLFLTPYELDKTMDYFDLDNILIGYDYKSVRKAFNDTKFYTDSLKIASNSPYFKILPLGTNALITISSFETVEGVYVALVIEGDFSNTILNALDFKSYIFESLNAFNNADSTENVRGFY